MPSTEEDGYRGEAAPRLSHPAPPPAPENHRRYWLMPPCPGEERG